MFIPGKQDAWLVWALTLEAAAQLWHQLPPRGPAHAVLSALCPGPRRGPRVGAPGPQGAPLHPSPACWADHPAISSRAATAHPDGSLLTPVASPCALWGTVTLWTLPLWTAFISGARVFIHWLPLIMGSCPLCLRLRHSPSMLGTVHPASQRTGAQHWIPASLPLHLARQHLRLHHMDLCRFWSNGY